MVLVSCAGSPADSEDAVAYYAPLAFGHRLVPPHRPRPHHLIHPCL